MLRWITERTGWSRVSLALGVLAGAAALPSFTDPWPANAGGFVFVVVTTVLVRGSVTLWQAFRQGWQEPSGRPVG